MMIVRYAAILSNFEYLFFVSIFSFEGDHPPITPCRSAAPHEFSGDMGRVYELVVRHFIASVSPDASWRSTKITFNVEALSDKGKFYLAGKQLIDPGFLKILLHKEYGDDTDKDDGEDEEVRTLPEFFNDEIIKIFNTGGKSSSSSKVNVVTSAPVWGTLDIKEKMTTAPGFLTESELIGMMEKHGIGTDASIPTHIQNIQNRNYGEMIPFVYSLSVSIYFYDTCLYLSSNAFIQPWNIIIYTNYYYFLNIKFDSKLGDVSFRIS